MVPGFAASADPGKKGERINSFLGFPELGFPEANL
jgi:hypothetical protein